MKAHLTERGVKGLQPKAKNIIVYDEEVVGFGVQITSGGTRAFVLTYRIEARERRLTIGAWPDWSVTAAREEAKRLKREVDQGCDPMAERDEARESPNFRQLIDRYLEEHAAKLAKRNRDDQAVNRSLLLDHFVCGHDLGLVFVEVQPVLAQRLDEAGEALPRLSL